MKKEQIGKIQLSLSSKFWRIREEAGFKIGHKDTVFYMTLVYEFGENDCENPISLSDADLFETTGIGKMALIRSRETLKKYNLISFEWKNQVCQYTLITE